MIEAPWTAANRGLMVDAVVQFCLAFKPSSQRGPLAELAVSRPQIADGKVVMVAVDRRVRPACRGVR